jgi:antitoxin CptB
MLLRTAKSCGPDAPMLASSLRSCVGPTGLRQSISAGDGGKRARSPGRARNKLLKPLRAGTSGDSGVLVVTRVRSTATKCTRDRGCSGHPAFPTPSQGRKIQQRLGRFAPRGRERVSGIEMSTLVMPGLDPGIHHSSQDHFEEDGLPGQAGSSPAITIQLIIRRTPGLTFAHTNAISTGPGTASGLLALDGFGKMTGSTRSSGGLDDRRKRLLFRCWHRGTREMDLILGRFADAEIATLKDDELAQLELLIEAPDPDLYAAMSGNRALAPEYASSLFDRIKSFRSADRDA